MSIRLPALWLLLVCAAGLVGGASALAHELRPAYLELRELGGGRYALLWKKPANGERSTEIAPAIPEGCNFEAPGRQQPAPGLSIVRGTLKCEAGLAGKTLRIMGLESTSLDVLVRIERGGPSETHILKPVSPSVTLAAVPGWSERAWTYVRLGIEHILLGADHMLFVLGLLLIVSNRWMLVKTITSFTVAHSITLAAATLGHVSVPAKPLSFAIALSILFLGPEIIRGWRGETSFSIRHPWMVAFAFGLLHGFGYASGLAAVGMPAAELPTALLLFNVGVEIGQLAFVVLMLLLARAFRALEIEWPRIVEGAPAYVVGSLGAFWTIDRLTVLLGDVR